METALKEKLFEVEFEPLNRKEVEVFENKNSILNSELDVSVIIGRSMKSIKDVLNLQVGDIIQLNKTIDESLDVNINDKYIAFGETVKIDDKVSIRISDFR